MANPRKPFRLNVGFLINAPIGYNRDFDFFIPQYTDDDLAVTDLDGFINIGRTPQGLLVRGKFTGGTTLECVRCLSDYQQILEWEFTELYAFKEENITESGLMVPEDAQLELQSLLREFALLEIPLKPICREDCKGLCTECGQNLNEQDCGHRPEIDSPFHVLKEFFKNQPGE